MEKIMVIKGLLYTKDHEWAKITGDTAIVGITHHAQEMLGEITYVELPEIDREVKQKNEIGVVESSKSASDVYSPVTGIITQVNSELQSTPEQINKDCYNAGWICKIKITDKSTTGNLMDSKAYEEYLKGL
jgi:glycine cleavage system H protein